MLKDRQMRFKTQLEISYTKLFNLYEDLEVVRNSNKLSSINKESLIITLEDEIEFLEIAIDNLYKEMLKGE